MKELSIKKVYKTIFISTMVWGLITHGVMFMNKYANFDELHSMFGIGATYTEGRWGLGILESVIRLLFGGMYSLPLFNGSVVLIFLAISGCIISEIFKLDNNIALILVSGILVTFPSLAGTFGYMYTAPAYAISIMVTMFGAYFLCCKGRKLLSFITGVLLLTFGMAIYQAYLPFAFCTMIIYMFLWTVDSMKLSWKEYVIEALWYVGSAVTTLVCYLVGVFISLAITGEHLISYKGMDNFGYPGVYGYILRFIRTYKEFFDPSTDNDDFLAFNMYHDEMLIAYYALLICITAFITIYIIRICKRGYSKSEKISRIIQLVLLLAVFPPASHIIFLMTREWFIYELMTYGETMTFIWLIVMVFREVHEIRITRVVSWISIVILSFSCVWYCHQSNIMYLKEGLMLSEATSYYDTLITRIESLDGYTDELPIAFLNVYEKEDANWAKIPELDDVTYVPYTWTLVVNVEAWTTHMKYYNGFEPQLITDEDQLNSIREKPQVQSMPHYPDDGAMQIIDGIIVVKF